MTSSSEESVVSPPEPSIAALSGDSWPARFRRAFLATRPKFLTASLLPVILGTGWGFRYSGQFDGLVFVLALFATVLVHAASNVWNDVGDEIAGSDAINDGRIHPYTGGSRFIQNGIFTIHEMRRLSIVLAVAALPLGAALIWLKGPVVLWFGVIGLALGYLYSSPAIRLSGRGVGEASVAVAFGVLPVCGAAWLQSGTIDWPTVTIAIPVSCWAACILLINEVPDAAADAATGKRTLAVRLGASGTAVAYLVLQLIALGAVLLLVFERRLSVFVLIVVAALAGAGWVASRRIVAADRGSLKKGIELTLAIHALGCLWLATWSVVPVD